MLYIELDKRILDCQDPLDTSVIHRTRQEDLGLSGSSGHLCYT